MRSHRRGFALIELLVTVGILSILIALVLPAVQQARETARQISCKNHLKQLALAAHNYHDTHQSFPPGFAAWPPVAPGAAANGNSVYAFLLSYLDQGGLASAWDFNSPRNNVSTTTADKVTHYVLPVLVCPSSAMPQTHTRFLNMRLGVTEVYALTSYGGNGGTRAFSPPRFPPPPPSSPILPPPLNPHTRDGVFHINSNVRIRDITDGTTNTLFFGERNHRDRIYDELALGAGRTPIASTGRWATSGHPLFGIGDVTLGTLVPINYSHQQGQPLDGQAEERRGNAFGSMHPDRADFALCDGSVRSLSENIDFQTFQALGTRSGGEVGGF